MEDMDVRQKWMLRETGNVRYDCKERQKSKIGQKSCDAALFYNKIGILRLKKEP